MPPRTDRRTALAMAATTLAVTWFFALSRGQDVNWDQQNYHLAVPALLLRGLFWASVAPSGIQSYFNPLILLPQYLAITTLPPMLATLAIATAQALSFIAAGWICRVIAGPDRTLAWLGFALCLASPIALSEAGTTYIDLITAMPVLAGFFLLLTRTDSPTPTRICVLAGVLLGLAAGLKLTNAMFLAGVPGLFLTGREPWRARLTRLFTTAAAAISGFLAIAGWWHWDLYQRFANPLFPFANGLFRSADFPPVSTIDDRYMGRTFQDILHYPLYWAFGGGPHGQLSPSGEIDPHDLRFLLCLLGLLVLIIACLLKPTLRSRMLAAPATGLLIGWCLIYLVWLYGFGIHRYMVGLETLTGAIPLILLQAMPTSRGRLALMLPACLACLIVLHVPRWTRLPFAPTWRTLLAQPIALPHPTGHPAMVILADAPTAFLAASLPADTVIIGGLSELDQGPHPGGTLYRQTQSLLASGHTPYLLAHAATPPTLALLASLKLHAGPDCIAISAAAQDFRLCALLADSTQ